jgi:hypothetical protein
VTNGDIVEEGNKGDPMSLRFVAGMVAGFGFLCLSAAQIANYLLLSGPHEPTRFLAPFILAAIAYFLLAIGAFSLSRIKSRG